MFPEFRCKKGRHTTPSGIVCLHAHTCDTLLQPGFSIRFPFTALLFVISTVSILFSGLQPAASASCCAVSTTIIPQPAFCTQAFSARALLSSCAAVSGRCRRDLSSPLAAAAPIGCSSFTVPLTLPFSAGLPAQPLRSADPSTDPEHQQCNCCSD